MTDHNHNEPGTHESPDLDVSEPGALTRRDFLALLGGTFALGACKGPPERVLPYTTQPEGLVPGTPLHYATTLSVEGTGRGLVVTSWEGRPTKIEGNPLHPTTQGAASALDQAFVLDLYDPDRAANYRSGQIPIARARFFRELARIAGKHQPGGGARLRFLVEPTSSPLLLDLRARVLARFPQTRFVSWSPAGLFENCHAGANLAFGRPLDAVYHFEHADVIVSLDADFLSPYSPLRYARDFSEGRDPLITPWPSEEQSQKQGLETVQSAPILSTAKRSMNRLYAVETHYSLVGASADHRLRLRPSQITAFALALLQRLRTSGDLATRAALHSSPIQGAQAPVSVPSWDRWLDAITRDLSTHRGRGLVIAGPRQPPIVHALAEAMNFALGNEGSTVIHISPRVPDSMDSSARLRDLARECAAGAVDTLVMDSFDPAYSCPGDLDFLSALQKVPERLYLGYHDDETALHCTLFAPALHPLESWGDTRGHEGTISFVQPLIAPLVDGIASVELLAGFLPATELPPSLTFNVQTADSANSGAPGSEAPPAPPPQNSSSVIGPSAHSLLREYWKRQSPRLGVAASDFDLFWDTSLQKGVVESSAPLAQTVNLEWTALSAALTARPTTPTAISGSEQPLELQFQLDTRLFDGRFANNGWLQELPDPLTRIAWDNPILLSPSTAQRLHLKDGDVLELARNGRKVRGPVCLQPGHADEALTVVLGNGRNFPSRHAQGTGFNAYPLRSIHERWFVDSIELHRVGGGHPLPNVQLQSDDESRGVALQTTLAELQRSPSMLDHKRGPVESLYPAYQYSGYKWAMAIDMSRCIACSACVVACQSENNIPWVGRAQVLKGREMHWLRIDRYWQGDADNPSAVPQPLACVHCENAPCEYVCPVNATVHSDEGLNEMVYNRCIGTRYCSNNCPYKVRRFNYLAWNNEKRLLPVVRMQMNPDVTVRERGVMEKCTYCVQRIERARIDSRIAGRTLGGNDVVTACAQSCPTRAITFGSLHDPVSRVSRLHDDPRAYKLLNETGTNPRTVHLARVKNPNPELA